MEGCLEGYLATLSAAPFHQLESLQLEPRFASLATPAGSDWTSSRRALSPLEKLRSAGLGEGKSTPFNVGFTGESRCNDGN